MASDAFSVVVLAGGTGAAKLAQGLSAAVSDLTVVANTADDITIHGAHVSPDPDLILFRLAGRLDARGWGLSGDTFHAMARLRERGEDVWFELGDEDLEIGRDRLRRLRAGERLTDAIEALRATLGVRARVLPMCDERVSTTIDGVPFQEWMIRHGGKAGDVSVEVVDVRFARNARMTAEVAAAVGAADVVVVGPSNPVISIGPILGTPGMRDALAGKLVVAVSPFVRGEVVKGPTAAFLKPATLATVAMLYGDLVDAWVADEPVGDRPTLVTDVLMADEAAQVRLAAEIVAFVKGFRP